MRIGKITNVREPGVFKETGFPYDVSLYFGEDGVPVVDVDTTTAANDQTYHFFGNPQIRIWLNDFTVLENNFLD